MKLTSFLAAAAAGLFLASVSCERHDWKETKVLSESHGHHGGHAEGGEHAEGAAAHGEHAEAAGHDEKKAEGEKSHEGAEH